MKNIPKQEPLALTISQACAILNIARSKIYYLWDSSSPYYDATFPKAFRLGKSAVRIDKNALLAWYHQQKNKASPNEAPPPADTGQVDGS